MIVAQSTTDPIPQQARPMTTGDIQGDQATGETADEAARREQAIRRVLRHGHTIDITTIGRRSGEPRRIEIVFHSFDGRIYISGTPSVKTRGWLHNLRANPRLTFHLKQLIQADLPATAREITDEAERRSVLEKVARVWRRDVEPMVRHSPLIEVTIDGFEPAAG
jgi:deazaflavin-dependent oxidoreductase (nitroreductase family)